VSEETHSGAGNGQRPGRPRVVPLPQKREVSEKHLANLRASALTDETIKLAELYTESSHLALAAIVERKAWPRQCGAALVFPFYYPDAPEPHAARVRATTPRVEKKNGKRREVKYDQAESHGNLVYFPPRSRAGRWYADPARVLYWTEGEKKSLALDQLGLPAVGLCGVWNWGDKKHKDETGEERLHPTLREHVAIAGRHHVICYDADSLVKENVMLAAARLCGVLKAAGALTVKFVCPPSTDHKGIDDYFFAFGGDAVLQLLATAEDLEPADPKNPLLCLTKIRALRDAPVSNDLRLPESYEVQRDGSLWWHGNEKHAPVAQSAILIQRFLDDRYTQEGRVEVCFERDGQWLSLCVSRRAIGDTRAMIAELVAAGAPVTSNNASKVVDWLEVLARVNSGRIERVSCVGRAGWHSVNGERVFVLDQPLHREGRNITLALDTRGDRRKLFSALTARGSLAGHIAALKRAWQADLGAAAMVCGALAATLLEPLGAPNFAIHLPGDSSRGKTSMLKIAGSVFGDPNNERWVASWNTTAIGAELRAAVLTDLPQCYDEVGSSDATQVERLVYMLVNGGGKTRAQNDLTIRETPTWRTVVLSTGEHELADEGTATGAQIRVIQLPVVGFGELTGAEVDELREACAANAGSFGRFWVEQLLSIDDWGPYRASLQEFTCRMRLHARNPLEGRTAAYFAILAVTEALAAQFGLGEPGGATMLRLFADQSRREQVESLADRALGLVQDWLMSEPDGFPELELSGSGEEDTPSRSRPNSKLQGFRKSNRQVIFIPAQFRNFCSGHRLSSREVLREWLQRGWLSHEPGRLDKSVRVGAKNQRFYVLEQPEDA
jgi:hypothetical protein